MENINITFLMGIVILVVVSSSLFLINYLDRKSEFIKRYFNEGNNIRTINKNNDWVLVDNNFKRGNESVKISHTREWK